MKTQIRPTTHTTHTATNLYNYAKNAQQVENLELQIKQKEKAIPHKSLPKGMLPGPVGTGKYSRRIRRGGELIRLKRR